MKSVVRAKRERRPWGWRSRFAALGILLWALMPIALILYLGTVSSGIRVVGEPQPVWVPVADVVETTNRQVQLDLTWSAPTNLVAPNWSGLVRAVHIRPGTDVKSGDIILKIDAVDRMAWHAKSPFYRSLSAGDQGGDVRELQRLLKFEGFGNSDTGRFDYETQRGVARLASKLGVAERVSAFLPEWVLYLPKASVKADEVMVSVGALAPASGETVFVARPKLLAAKLAAPTGAVAATPSGLVATAEELLIVGTEEIELDDERQKASSAGLAALDQVLKPEDELVVGVLERRLDRDATEVSVAAVHTDPDGTNCVMVKRGSAQPFIENVEILGGSDGRTAVAGGLTTSDRVGIGIFEVNDRCN